MTSTRSARLLVAVFMTAISAGAASAAPETDVAVVEGTARNAPNDPRSTTFQGSTPEAPSAEPTARGTTDRSTAAPRETTDRTARRSLSQKNVLWAVLLFLVVAGGAAAASN